MKAVAHASIKSHQVNPKHLMMLLHIRHETDIYLWYENETAFTFFHFLVTMLTHTESQRLQNLSKRLLKLNLIETHLLFTTTILLLNRTFNQGRRCPAKEALTSQKIPMVATTTMTTIGLMNFMATRPMS